MMYGDVPAGGIGGSAMVAESVVVPLFAAAARTLLTRGAKWLFDRATVEHRPARQAETPVGRQDLSAGGLPVSDADIAIDQGAFALPMPALLMIQDGHGRIVPFPMMSGEIAHVTVRRGHHVLAALTLNPWLSADVPTLTGVGWRRARIASGRTLRVTVTTRPPTWATMGELGLVNPDGTSPFRLQGRTATTRQPGNQAADAARCRAASPGPGGRSARCGRPAQNGLGTHLCAWHTREVRDGAVVRDFETGTRYAR
ncbi:hypothetical protein MF672_043400 [Actinomadura sp. ATCC 31491]|uniref:Uncharacterized protein n=1 Tax=Actinomadura luzonensis TaxID=2805427 RepID=A0ABT0G907_9ACTN|nr:hypothetical protein [Actinomadura luzonensis]MCK2220603.1 hypothetical protein [Actinomadura luzonensis]